MTMLVRTIVAVTAFAAGLIVGRPAGADNKELARFLAAVEEANTFPIRARSDFQVDVKKPSGTRRYEGAAIYQGTSVYVELREPPLRLLIESKNGPIYQSSAGSAARKVGDHDPITDSTLVPDDFRPFRGDALEFPQITSDTNKTLLVNGAPKPPSPYVLIAYLLDREKLVAVRVQYYERVVSNLVRMRRESELIEVAGRWRASETEIEDYRNATIAHIKRRWQTGVDATSDLFDPATFSAATVLKPSAE